MNAEWRAHSAQRCSFTARRQLDETRLAGFGVRPNDQDVGARARVCERTAERCPAGVRARPLSENLPGRRRAGYEAVGVVNDSVADNELAVGRNRVGDYVGFESVIAVPGILARL